MKRGMFRRRFIRYDFATTLSVIFSVLIAIPVLCVMLLANATYTRNTLERIRYYNTNLATNLAEYIDDYYNSIINLCTLPLYAGEMQQVIKGEHLFPFESEGVIAMENLSQFSDFLRQIHESQLGLEEMYIYCQAADRVIYYARYLPDKALLSLGEDGDFRNTPWYRTTAASGGLYTLLTPDTLPGANHETLCYMTRQIRDVNTGAEIGTMLFSVDTRRFVERCTNFLSSPEDRIFIVDASGALRYAPPVYTDALLEEVLRLASSRHETLTVSDGSEDYFTSSVFSDTFQWTIVCLFPFRSALASTNMVTLVLVMLAVVILAAFLLISHQVSRYLTRPIRNLREGMHAVENGDLTVQVPVDDEGELGTLNQSFNKMVRRLDVSIHQAYVMELEKKQAQVLSLQSQIKPHFLYNTLNSIQMMAILNKDYRVSRMLSMLGNLLHYVMSEQARPVVLADELSMLADYVELRALQKRETITYVEEVPEELKAMPCMKMLLEPLVENSFMHADLAHIEAPEIRVTAEAIEGGYRLQVCDNGAGIAPERLQALQDMLASASIPAEDDGAHIGLANVNFRLRTLFAPGSGIALASTKGQGTVVTITVYPGEEEGTPCEAS